MLERHFAERDRQAQRGDALDQCVEHDLKLRTRELLAHALVAAVAEAELLADVTTELELVGLRDRRPHPSSRARDR